MAGPAESTPDSQTDNKHSCLGSNLGSQQALSANCACYHKVCVSLCMCVCVCVIGLHEGNKRREHVILRSSFCHLSFFILLIYRDVGATVDHDSLKDTLMQLVPTASEQDPVALTVCSIIIYIPYRDQTRTRTKDTYLSFCSPVNLKQDLEVCICHFSVLAPACANLSSLHSIIFSLFDPISDSVNFSIFLLLSVSFCVLPLRLTLTQQQHLHLLSPMATHWGYFRLQAD